jgi:hypothetical protein
MQARRDIPLQAGIFLNLQERISDPANGVEGYCWVTVNLPNEMSYHSHRSDEFVSFVIHTIKARNVIIGDRALHSLGAGCISPPVKNIDPRSKRENETPRGIGNYLGTTMGKRVTWRKDKELREEMPLINQNHSQEGMSVQWGRRMEFKVSLAWRVRILNHTYSSRLW